MAQQELINVAEEESTAAFAAQNLMTELQNLMTQLLRMVATHETGNPEEGYIYSMSDGSMLQIRMKVFPSK